RQIEAQLQQREEADGQQHVVREGQDRAYRKLALEAAPDVDVDGQQRDQHRARARGSELARYRRTDALDPALDVIVAERGNSLVQRLLLRLLATRLLLEADQNVIGGTELLDLHVAEAESAKRLAHLGQV